MASDFKCPKCGSGMSYDGFLVRGNDPTYPAQCTNPECMHLARYKKGTTEPVENAGMYMHFSAGEPATFPADELAKALDAFLERWPILPHEFGETQYQRYSCTPVNPLGVGGYKGGCITHYDPEVIALFDAHRRWKEAQDNPAPALSFEGTKDILDALDTPAGERQVLSALQRNPPRLPSSGESITVQTAGIGTVKPGGTD